ncbi:hypothetical protein B0H11DRAFT_1995775 [Mycena galericulata]|nr:hypothetical protein B0H11DRAFT_1995775 [Mycena galericulata]
MHLHPTLLAFSAMAHAVFGGALAPPSATEVLTAPPALQPTEAPSPELSSSLSCWCETIPSLNFTTFCLPCSTIFFPTGTNRPPTTTATGTQ